MLPSIASAPDTPLAVAADGLLLESSPLPLVNHCRRTYAFGAALLQQRHRRYDAEALYIAAMLHDLGLTDTWEDGVTPFERRGAQVASTALLERGARPELAALVHDAIALHLEITTAKDPRPEVAGVSLGAAVDVIGLRLTDLPAALAAEALERFPRHGAKEFLIGALQRQARLKPTSRIAGHIEQFQFDELIAAAPFDS